MRYAVSYVSTCAPNLSKVDISELFEQTTQFNNHENITGFLIYSNDNFFQFIEGEKEDITKLYSRIENDIRHQNLIKFIEKPVSGLCPEGYICDSKEIDSDYDESKIKVFHNYLTVLDPPARKAALRIMETILM